MSERVESRILALIEDAARSPYGNPIPGLDELGWAGAAVPASGVSVAEAVAVGSHTVQIVRIGEPAQVEPESLEVLLSNGIVPGAQVEVGSDGDRVRLCAAHHQAISVPREVASHLFASPVR